MNADFEQIHITKPQMKYLLAVKKLSDAGMSTRRVDIAAEISASRASVSIALPKLEELGLIEGSGDNIVLTEKGSVAVGNSDSSAANSKAHEGKQRDSLDYKSLLASERSVKLDELKATGPEKRYLLYIAELSQKGKLRKAALASEMGCSRAAVTMAVTRMTEAGLVVEDDNGFIDLSKTVRRYLGM